MSPRRAWLFALLMGLALSPARARAQGRACQAQLREAQDLQYAGKLLLARPLALACAEAPSCDARTHDACGQLLASLRRQIPSRVFSIIDERGFETDEVSLYIDAELRTPAVPSTPFELDPGAHELRAELRDGSSRSLRVVLAPGEQLRRVQLSFAPEPNAKRPSSGTPRWLTISLGSLALVSAGSFGYFALDGRARAHELESGCAPACEPGPVTSMRRAYLVADISWIVGALAAGGATWSFFSEAP